MDAVGYYVRRHTLIRENLAEKSGTAMIQRPHRIERVCCMPGAGVDGGACRSNIRVRMSETDANSALHRLGDYFDSVVQLRRNCHNAYVAPRRLPESFKGLEVRNEQVFRQMYSATHMAQERTFQMNAEWTSAAITVLGFDRIGQVL